MVSKEMKDGNLVICDCCENTIREMESYVWDTKASERGDDEPKKTNDHAMDALRYVIATHKVETYKPYKSDFDPGQYTSGRFNPTARRF